MIELPEILNIPEKLLPVLTEINNYDYFLIEGGRGGGKSQSIARIILWLCEQRKIRVCCGRETQASVSDSVCKIFADLIADFNLDFTVKSNKIFHNVSGSDIIFKGFREQGRVNIKGLEGVDILWIDESQAITKSTLDVIIPTIRKKDSKVIFTMNRLTRRDPVYSEFVCRDDCLHIKINYYDNKYCPKKLLSEAKRCKEKNLSDYEHIWEGNPLEAASDFLFSAVKLDKAKKIVFSPDNSVKIRCMSVDLAGNGGDLCVASLLESKNSSQWNLEKQEFWSEPDTDITKGRIINLYSLWKPHLLILDADGLGYSIYVSIRNVISGTLKFNGAAASNRPNALNRRADGYLTLKDFIDNEWLKISSDTLISQLEYIKKAYKPNGQIYIQSKKDMKSEHGESPDFADSLMMGVFAVNYYSYLTQEHDETVILDSNFDPYG